MYLCKSQKHLQLPDIMIKVTVYNCRNDTEIRLISATLVLAYNKLIHSYQQTVGKLRRRMIVPMHQREINIHLVAQFVRCGFTDSLSVVLPRTATTIAHLPDAEINPTLVTAFTQFRVRC